jgi:hypothetical protein
VCETKVWVDARRGSFRLVHFANFGYPIIHALTQLDEIIRAGLTQWNWDEQTAMLLCELTGEKLQNESGI